MSIIELYPWLSSSYSRKNKESLTTLSLSSRKKLWWKCTQKTRHTYKCTIAERIRRYEFHEHNGCPRCIFYGEEVVLEFLRLKNIVYEQEKKFNWNGLYRFDIFIQPNILIEIDGEQHFKRKSRKWDSPRLIYVKKTLLK